MNDFVTDDFGNVMHWTVTVHSMHSMGLYGYAEHSTLFDCIDFGELS